MARKSPAQAAVALRIEFSPIGRIRVQVTFDEPELSSDGGALRLREAAQILTFPTEWACITGRTGRQAAAGAGPHASGQTGLRWRG